MFNKVILFFSLSCVGLLTYAQQADLVCHSTDGSIVVSGSYIAECSNLQFFNLKSGTPSQLTSFSEEQFDIVVKDNRKTPVGITISSSAESNQKIRLLLKLNSVESKNSILYGIYEVNAVKQKVICRMETDLLDQMRLVNQNAQIKIKY